MSSVIAFTKVNLPYGCFGNMSPHIVNYNGQWFKTSEHLFQCLRFVDHPEIFEEIRAEKSPMSCKMKAKKHRHLITIDTMTDVHRMRDVVRLKLDQHLDIKKKLMGTKDATIIEDCTNRPHGSGLFWGAALQNGVWVGDNVLGLIWMELREELL